MSITRRIVHADADSFFISVEAALRPELADKPAVAYGGGRGVVLSATYPARKFGITAGMPIHMAKQLCPGLLAVTGRYEAYSRAGEDLFNRVAEVGGVLEMVSVDEAYWDVTELIGERFSNESELCAWTRNLVRERFHLPLSMGVAGNKPAAKMACSSAKPDGFRIIAPGGEREFMSALPVSAIGGVGPVTLAKLREIGIESIDQLSKASTTVLANRIGKAHALYISEVARGGGDTPVRVNGPAKSVGTQRTFAHDLYGKQADAEFEVVMAEALSRLKESGSAARSVKITHKLSNGEDIAKSRSLNAPTDSPIVLAQAGRSIHVSLGVNSLKLIGVSFGGVVGFAQEELGIELGEVGPVKLPKSRAVTLTEAGYYGLEVVHNLFGAGMVIGQDGEYTLIRFVEKDRFINSGSSAIALPV